MKRSLAILAAVALALAQKPVPPAVEEKLPLEPPVQPIPFNHKLHIANGLKCSDCHALKDSFQAGYPKETTCMACHVAIKKDSLEIQKLASFVKSKTAIPWVKIYSVPEIVWFSHQSHVNDAKFTCDTCHGPVAQREVLFKERPTNMFSCMACHAKHRASNGCDYCHNTQ